QPHAGRYGVKRGIHLPAGGRFRDRKIVQLETQPRSAAGIFVTHAQQPLATALGQRSGRLAYALRVVTELLVKTRTFADGAIDLVRAFRMIEWKDVGLHGSEERGRGVRVLAEDGLAADDD